MHTGSMMINKHIQWAINNLEEGIEAVSVVQADMVTRLLCIDFGRALLYNGPDIVYIFR